MGWVMVTVLPFFFPFFFFRFFSLFVCAFLIVFSSASERGCHFIGSCYVDLWCGVVCACVFGRAVHGPWDILVVSQGYFSRVCCRGVL